MQESVYHTDIHSVDELKQQIQYQRCNSKDRTMRCFAWVNFQNGGCPSIVLDFHFFATFVKNSNLHLLLCRPAKFGEDLMICG